MLAAGTGVTVGGAVQSVTNIAAPLPPLQDGHAVAYPSILLMELSEARRESRPKSSDSSIKSPKKEGKYLLSSVQKMIFSRMCRHHRSCHHVIQPVRHPMILVSIFPSIVSNSPRNTYKKTHKNKKFIRKKLTWRKFFPYSSSRRYILRVFINFSLAKVVLCTKKWMRCSPWIKAKGTGVCISSTKTNAPPAKLSQSLESPSHSPGLAETTTFVDEMISKERRKVRANSKTHENQG